MSAEYEKHIKRILISEEEIREKVAWAGRQLSREYEGKPLLLVSILNGAFVFLADLCREISEPCEIAFLRTRSYFSQTVSCGEVSFLLDLEADISKYHVVIAEDIIDSGRTLRAVVEKLRQRNPLSLRVVTLLDKPSRRAVDFKADVSLFTIPDYFVVGYGLDCGEQFRNLRYIAEYQP